MNKRFRRTYRIPEEVGEDEQIRCREINRADLFVDFSREIQPGVTYLVKLESEIKKEKETYTHLIDDVIYIYQKNYIEDLLKASKKALHELSRISAQHNVAEKRVIESLSKAIKGIYEEADNE